jgi:hypothetical protein
VLIEITDQGIGVSESRLADMNWRLDNPPTIDVSVSRHMGLFAVARLAERHRVRVRLRAASPQGVSALVWLPDSVIERVSGSGTGQWQVPATSGLPVRTPRGQDGPALPAGAVPAGGPTFGRSGTLPVRSAEQARSRLTGFQRGTRRAESQGGAPNGHGAGQNGQSGHNGQNGHSGQGGTSPHAGEGTMS